jgi:hypothetical protein
MVARNRIRCTVVKVASSDMGLSRGAIARDILPWADPYVAQLIKNLQDEVRSERRMKSLVRHYSLMGGDGASASGMAASGIAARGVEASTSGRISAVK